MQNKASLFLKTLLKLPEGLVQPECLQYGGRWNVAQD